MINIFSRFISVQLCAFIGHRWAVFLLNHQTVLLGTIDSDGGGAGVW